MQMHNILSDFAPGPIFSPNVVDVCLPQTVFLYQTCLNDAYFIEFPKESE